VNNRFETSLMDLISSEVKRNTYGYGINNKLMLGGVNGENGGSGIPWGGVVGGLNQRRVCYDTTEAALISGTSDYLLASGSLLNNLNHIRWHQIPATWMETTPLEPRSMQVHVASGIWYNTVNSYIEFEGGVSPVFTLPSGNDRIDVLYLKPDGSLDISEGLESATPVPIMPTTSGVLPLSEIYLKPTTSGIGWVHEFTDTIGKIDRDIRPFLTYPPGTGGGGGGGSTSFTGLTDTPNSYVGEATKIPAVNAGEDALEFVTKASLGASIDHGTLIGLADDDHSAVYPGYAQVETITGLWTFDRGANAPFAVDAASTVVANLDADKLDGYEASAFPRKAENATITGTWVFDEAIEADKNADSTSYFGRAAVGYNGTHGDFATFAHLDRMNGTQYAVLQSSAGTSYFNSVGTLYLRISNATEVQMDTSGVRIAHGLWVGSVGTAPDDNDVHIDGSIMKSTPLGFRGYNNAAQSIPHNTVTTLAFNTVITNAGFSVTSNKYFKATNAGYYICGAAVRWDASAATRRMALVVVMNNGTADRNLARNDLHTSQNSVGGMGISSGMVYLDGSDDYFKINVYQDSGGALNVRAATLANQHECSAWIARIA